MLGSVLAGTVLASLVVGRHADTVGRRRCYTALYALLATSAVAFAFVTAIPLLVVVSLLGALSTEVIESGPFTTLEQAMLAGQFETRRLARGFSVYNAVAAAGGSLGALAAAGIGPVRDLWPNPPDEQRFFLLLVPAAVVGLVLARRLSEAVEQPRRDDAVPARIWVHRDRP